MIDAEDHTKQKNKSSTNKSNHKHEYKECLFRLHGINAQGEYIETYKHGICCIDCGRIKDIKMLEYADFTDVNKRRLMTNDEMREKYKDLYVYDIAGIFDKYIKL